MNAKNVFIFLLGISVGAGGMFLALNKPITEKIEKRVNEELEKINKTRKEISEPKEEPKEEEPAKEEPPKPVTSVDIPEEHKASYENLLKKVDYTKSYNKEEPVKTMTDAVTEETEKIIEPAVKKSSKKTKVPKKVTQDEFDATALDDRKTLYFYADGILADIVDDVVYDPVETMGATNFKQFKSTCDTVYIFNYSTNLMYEIIYSNSCYSEVKREMDE